MIDNDRVLADPVPARSGSLKTRVTRWLLGPGDKERLERFSPYYPRFDLRPPPTPFGPLVVPLAALGIACLVAAPSWWVLHTLADRTRASISQVAQEAQRRRVLDEKYQQISDRLGKMEKEESALVELLGGGIRWSGIVDEIRSQLPPGLRISALSAGGSGSIRIEGQAVDLRSIGSFMLFLRASGDFARPTLQYSQRKAVPGGSARTPEGAPGGLYSFVLNVDLASSSSNILPPDPLAWGREPDAMPELAGHDRLLSSTIPGRGAATESAVGPDRGAVVAAARGKVGR